MDFWGNFVLDQKTASDIHKSREKNKNMFGYIAVNYEQSSNGMFHLNKDSFKKRVGTYTYRSQQWAAS